MMRNRWITAAGLCIALAFGLYVVHGQLEDGLHGELLAITFDTQTEYAPGYDYDVYSQLGVGDSKQSVHQRLGSPLSTWIYIQDGSKVEIEVLAYSEPAGSMGHYRQRDIHITNGEIVKKVHCVYID